MCPLYGIGSTLTLIVGPIVSILGHATQLVSRCITRASTQGTAGDDALLLRKEGQVLSSWDDPIDAKSPPLPPQSQAGPASAVSLKASELPRAVGRNVALYSPSSSRWLLAGTATLSTSLGRGAANVLVLNAVAPAGGVYTVRARSSGLFVSAAAASDGDVEPSEKTDAAVAVRPGPPAAAERFRVRRAGGPLLFTLSVQSGQREDALYVSRDGAVRCGGRPGAARGGDAFSIVLLPDAVQA